MNIYLYLEITKIFNMKNLKKLDRNSLKKVNGGSETCQLNCEIHETCGTGCSGQLICVPRGLYIPDNC